MQLKTSTYMFLKSYYFTEPYKKKSFLSKFSTGIKAKGVKQHQESRIFMMHNIKNETCKQIFNRNSIVSLFTSMIEFKRLKSTFPGVKNTFISEGR